MCINNFRYLMAVEEDKPPGTPYRGPVERLLIRLVASLRRA